MLEANQELLIKLQDKIVPRRLDKMIEIDEGFQVPVKMLFPPDMREGVKYPLLVKVYSGPGSQMINHK
jgi:hypothetical protein